MWSEIGVVSSISLFSTGLTLFLEWFLVTSNADYKRLEENLEDTTKKIEKVKKEGDEKKGNKKRQTELETRLSDLKSQIAIKRIWLMFLTPVVLMSALSVVNSLYRGQIVGR